MLKQNMENDGDTFNPAAELLSAKLAPGSSKSRRGSASIWAAPCGEENGRNPQEVLNYKHISRFMDCSTSFIKNKRYKP